MPAFSVGQNPSQTASRLEKARVKSAIDLVQSRLVLDRVITNLNLSEKWGKAFGLKMLTTDMTYLMLKSRLKVEATPTANVYEVKVRTDTPAEAVAIANEVARVMTSFKKHDNSLPDLPKDSETLVLSERIRNLKKDIEALAVKLGVQVDIVEPPDLKPTEPRFAFFEMRRELEQLQNRRAESIARTVDQHVSGGFSPQISRVTSVVISDVPWVEEIKLIAPTENISSQIDPTPFWKMLLLLMAIACSILGIILLIQRSAEAPNASA